MKNLFSLVFVLLLVLDGNAQGGIQHYLNGQYVNCISKSSSGIIMVGTDEGLWRYMNGTFIQIPQMSKYLITDIVPDQTGGFWIATRGRKGTNLPLTSAPGGGIFRLHDAAINDTMRWSEDNGLQSRYVTSIDVDQFGTVWAAHNSRTAIDGITIERAGGLSKREDPIAPTNAPFVADFPDLVLPFLPCYTRNAEAISCGLGATWLATRQSEDGCVLHVSNIIYKIGSDGSVLDRFRPDSFPNDT